MGIVIECRGDLLSSDECLAHCVSADFHMSAGVARPIKHRFGGVRELLAQRRRVGEVAYLFRDNRIIFYLVTRRRYYDLPTLNALRSCLRVLAQLCYHFEITRLSISRLGCGLDRLNWNQVKSEIRMAFSTTNVVITVYYLS